MKLLVDTRLYPPATYAGAELAVHGVLRHLLPLGHEAIVLVREGVDGELDDVRVLSVPRDDTAAEEAAYAWADVAITHLEASLWAMPLAAKHNVPLVHYVHNETQLSWTSSLYASLIVFNSQTLALACAGQHPGVPSLVVNPPVYLSDVVAPDLEINDHTLVEDVYDALQVSLSELKGGFLFWRLAQREVDRRFLAVTGGYGVHIDRGAANARVLPHLPAAQMGYAYGTSRILLVPSEYETWGRVAVEAMANGLPIIAHPSPGLREAIGSGGVKWAHRGAPEQWSSALALLDEPELYGMASAASYTRTAELQREQAGQLNELTARLETLAS